MDHACHRLRDIRKNRASPMLREFYLLISVNVSVIARTSRFRFSSRLKSAIRLPLFIDALLRVGEAALATNASQKRRCKVDGRATLPATARKQLFSQRHAAGYHFTEEKNGDPQFNGLSEGRLTRLHYLQFRA